MFRFIKRERMYVLMLFFILAMNLLGHGRVEERHYERKKAFSSMTFQEMGISEQRLKDFFESGRPSALFFEYSVILGIFIFIIALLMNLSFIFLRRPFILFPPGRRDGECEAVSWGIADLIRVSVIIVFLAYAIGGAEGFIFKFFNIDTGLKLRMMLGTFFVDITVIAVVLYFVLVRYRENLRALGLRWSFFFRDVLSGIMAYIFILPLLAVILLASIWILNLLGYTPPPQPVFEIFMEEKRSRMLFFLTLFVSIFGPIVEEIFFRGFMYSAIKKRLGITSALFLSASIFSLLHTNIAGFFPIMTLALLLAYLYETTGSLTASITVHMIHNSVIVMFVFFIKQLMS